MRRFISLLLAVTMVVTMPGSFSVAKRTEAKAAEVVSSADFTGVNIVLQNMEYVDDSNPEHEAYTYSVSKGGITGRMVPNNYYAYFKVNDNVITQSDNNLFIEITYYDEGSDTFQLQYNATSANYKGASISKSNSNSWVTTTVCLEDASFKNAQNGKCDFRIWGTGSYGVTISRVRITKQSVNPDAEPIAERTGGTAASEFKGKCFTGYQGWFGTGGQYNSWQHYAYGDAESDGTRWPRPNNISIDYFPDVTEYKESSLAQTGFANLGNGTATKLFDSNATDVIDTHFRWMKEYGIDGAAVQRFVGGLTGRTITSTPEVTQLNKIKNAAEENGRLMYVMYDISGGTQISDTNDTTSISSYVKDMKFDWVYNIEQALKLPNSSSYATVNGKPVVCVWGFGFNNSENTRPNRRVDYEEMIDFFHERGCYVIIGVPREWRDQSQYLDIYNKADMISPWYVGALGDEASVDSVYTNYLQPDLAYCNNNEMEYYPVVFSGFSWCLWQGAQPNMIPRNAGQLFWYQVYKLKQLGVNSFYTAMFDEYDEGTAIAKNATDYFDIPTDQYFVTASADGYWLSSDFQLRVAGEAIKMAKGEREAVRNVPVEHSLGPVYYRNSFESKYVTCKDTQYNGYYPVDPCFKNDKQIVANNVSGTTKIERNSTSKTGDYLTSISGNSYASGGSYKYQISETAITIKKGMKLSYSIYAVNDLGRNTYVDLICSDGTHISTGVNLGAGSAKGNVGSWTDVTYTFGSDAFVGKKIIGIALCYQGNAGYFNAYYDNVIIEDGDEQIEDSTTESPTVEKQCDLVVTNISTDRNYYAGEEAQFIVKIKNMGTVASPVETKHGVALSVDGTVVNWCDTFFGSLQPQEEITLTMNWGPNEKSTWTVTEGAHTVSAQVNDTRDVTESDTTNNIYDTSMIFVTKSVETTIEINGFQISTTLEGYRTVYSVSDASDEVDLVGMIYGLSDYISDTDMVVGSIKSTVFAYQATETGKMDMTFSEKEATKSYTMTMKFNTVNTSFYNAKISVRAYARLKDGRYIYSDVVDMSVYSVASHLYENIRMNTITAHNYLYNNILKLVNPDYKEVDYYWGNTVVNPDKI